MSRQWSAVVWLSCVMGTASAAGSQTLLTEADALARLSAESPRLRAVRAEVDVARAEAATVGAWPNPRVTYGREATAGVTEHMTTVLQPLPVTGRRAFERDAATASAGAVEQRAESQMRRLQADLRLAFADLVAAQARERIYTRALVQVVELARILAAREAAGDAAGYDRLRAERDVVDVSADVAAAAVERARAQGQLSAFFGPGTDATTLVAAETMAGPGATALPPAGELVRGAEATRSELRAWQQDGEAARLAERAAGRRALPEPELLAGTKTSNASGGDVGSVLSVQAVIPLFARGKPERAAAAARASQAAAQADAFRAVLRAQVGTLRALAAERAALAERYRASSVPGADEVERIAQVSYDAGERGILELLDAFRGSAAARLRQLALDLSARQALVELAFVSGWEIPR